MTEWRNHANGKETGGNEPIPKTYGICTNDVLVWTGNTFYRVNPQISGWNQIGRAHV